MMGRPGPFHNLLLAPAFCVTIFFNGSATAEIPAPSLPRALPMAGVAAFLLGLHTFPKWGWAVSLHASAVGLVGPHPMFIA